MARVPPLTALYTEHLTKLGDGRPITHREAARRAGDEQKYETFRLIGKGEHSGRINEDTVAALVALGLDERAVRKAAGHQLLTSPGPFLLPDRANRLTLSQREVVVSVVDAILTAGEQVVADRDRPGLRAAARPRRTTQ